MQVEYKVVEKIKEKGKLVSQRVRFYVGEVTTEDQRDVANPDSDVLVPVTAFRRTAMLQEIEYTFDEIVDDEKITEFLKQEAFSLATEIKEEMADHQNTFSKIEADEVIFLDKITRLDTEKKKLTDKLVISK